MNTNGISSTNSSYSTSATYADSKTSKTKTESAATKSDNSNTAAVYESTKDTPKTDSAKKTYTRDSETIKTMLNDVKQRQQQLQSLVERTLLKQGKTLGASESIWDALKSGNLEFSADDIAQAKEDVSEDGYWGVEQTSERLYSFAYALAGGDPSKADTMMSAIEKGFKQATKTWGSDLPDICSKTLDATREKINAWKNQDSADSKATESTEASDASATK